MRKIHLLGLTLLAVFAFSVVAAASASALEWLVKGLTFAGSLPVETTGSLKLIHLKGGFLEPEVVIECAGTFDGTIEGGAAGLGTVTELLESAGHAVTLTNQLSCTSVVGPCTAGTILVAPENLPWLTTLEAMATSNLDLFSSAGSGKPAYEIECTALGSKHVTLCEGETSASLELMGTAMPFELLGIFTAEELELEGLEGLCEEGGTNHNNVALQEGNGVVKQATPGTEEIDVS
jgi:hypothetical protein